jgi:hypothetical protein
MEPSVEETTKVGIKRIETQPRTIVFKANNKDLEKSKDLIETKFPEVEIIYVTTGPAASILHVTKSMPIEHQNSLSQPFYSIE